MICKYLKECHHNVFLHLRDIIHAFFRNIDNIVININIST